MVDPTTTNRTFAIPTHGSDVDTWDQPVNNNMALLDTILGGQQSVAAVNGGSTTLNATQLSGGLITVSGAIAGNSTIVFPAVQGWWSMYNTTTAGVLFVQTTGATERIAVPPGVITDIQILGTTTKFRNFPMVGSFIDYPSATVPSWITGCTIPPFLLCDGTTFSAVTYPYLNTILGGNTLPDYRGRSGYYLNGATSRLTVAGAGIDGSTLGATTAGALAGNGINLAANQIPSIPTGMSAGTVTVVSPASGKLVYTSPAGSNVTTIQAAPTGTIPVPATSVGSGFLGVDTLSSASPVTVTYVNASLQVVNNAAPGIVGGIRMIRAA